MNILVFRNKKMCPARTCIDMDETQKNILNKIARHEILHPT